MIVKRTVAFIATCLLGIGFIAFAIFVICDLQMPNAKNMDVLDSAEYVGFTENDSLYTAGDLSYLSFDELIARGEVSNSFRYVELKLQNLSEGGAYVLANYSENGLDFTEINKDGIKIKNGRNFLKIEKKNIGIKTLHIHFPNGVSFRITSLKLYEHMPLRSRHIALFALLCGIWIWLCTMLIKDGKLKFAHIVNFKRYSYLLSSLVKKDFVLKYRRSFIGVLWSVLNPLFMATIITLVFNNLFTIRTEHFPVYFLTGSLMFTLMSDATSGALTSVLGASSLIKKVYIPKYIFPVEKCLFALVNMLFSFIALLIVMLILGISFKPTILLFWIPMLYVLVFSIGVGMILAAVNVFFRDIGHLYGVWIVAWMYLTPIMYPQEMLPQSLRDGLMFNPMFHYVDYFRKIMMYNTVPDLAANITCIVFSLSAFIVGLVIFMKSQRKFILYI
jgi:ABC-2 type transport system permease protein